MCLLVEWLLPAWYLRPFCESSKVFALRIGGRRSTRPFIWEIQLVHFTVPVDSLVEHLSAVAPLVFSFVHRFAHRLGCLLGRQDLVISRLRGRIRPQKRDFQRHERRRRWRGVKDASCERRPSCPLFRHPCGSDAWQAKAWIGKRRGICSRDCFAGNRVAREGKATGELTKSR